MIVVRMKERKMRASLIQELTLVAPSTQRKIFHQFQQNQTVSTPKPQQLGSNNPNAKIPSNFKDMLLGNVKNFPALTDDERAQELSKKCKKKITAKIVRYWRSKIKITRKRSIAIFENAFTPKHLKQRDEFLATFHPETGITKFTECTSTDESGFSSGIRRNYAYSQILAKVHRIKRMKKLAGGSYRNNSSRAKVWAPKVAKFKTNLILTISTHPHIPVIGYKIDRQYWNSQRFADYIAERYVPEHTVGDLIDRASFHRKKKDNTSSTSLTVDEAYYINGIKAIYIPTGYPEYNPIEQAFNYLKTFVKTKREKLRLKSDWSEEQLTSAITEAIKSITHKHVLSWYRNSWCHMFPNLIPPNYLNDSCIG